VWPGSLRRGGKAAQLYIGLKRLEVADCVEKPLGMFDEF
jgi:hypothetical protein